MRIIDQWQGLDEACKGASVALGNFDGVHLGHQSVIALARTNPRHGVITFEPHPRQFFAPQAPAFRLMNAQARAHRLEKLGLTHLYQLPFTQTLAAMSAEAFATDVLAHGLGVTHVVVGADFRFGKGRAGTAQTLETLGQSLNFQTTVAPLLAIDGTEISSTSIRAALTDGRPRDAAKMLGHWHRIEGMVIHGEKRGRTLGFPTANQSLTGLHLPRFGVYATRADILTGPYKGTYNAASSLGVRPQYGENLPNLETFLFDFDGDLYGETLSIALVDYLRPEATFPSLDTFVAQMHADCARARQILTTL